MKVKIEELYGKHEYLLASQYGKGRDKKLFVVTEINDKVGTINYYEILDHRKVVFSGPNLSDAVSTYNNT